MLTIHFNKKMAKNVKRMKKRGKDLEKLITTLDMLASREQMPEKYRDHALKGKLKNYRECHIEPDWLLVYRIFEDQLILLATGTGTHADLFGE